MGRSAFFVLTAAVALSLGCGGSSTPTVLVLEIGSNFEIPGEMDRIMVEATARGGTTRQLPFALGTKENVTLPLRVGLLAPDADPEGEITIVAKGFKGTVSLTQEDAVVSAVKGRSRVLKLFLAKECVGYPCSVDQTCTGGPTCIRIRRDSPDAGGGGDGAVTDAPSADVPSNTDVPSNIDVPSNTDVPALETRDGGANDACNCPAPSNPCLQARCEGGACVTISVANMTACAGGVCWQGACCTGCISANVCQPGTQVGACGGGGKACQACDDNNACTRDLCTAAACGSEKLTGGTCPTGVCIAGVCACGAQGEPCCAMTPACQGALTCQNGTCGQCGALGQDCCAPGNTCGSGLTCGATTNKCEPCGDVNQACCGAGTPCRVGVCSAARVCQACGGFGQPCCAGNSCLADNNLCNGNEICQNGTCGRALPVTCAPSDQCHNAGTCDTATGQCSNPVKPAGTPCNDANMCTTGETCQNGTCGAGAAQSCNDNNPCTVDSCAPTSGCAHANGSAGVACATDNNACTSDVCNSAGACTHPAVGNGIACTAPGLTGVCSAGSCVECLMNSNCPAGRVCRTSNNTCCTLTPNPCAGIQCGSAPNGCGGTVNCSSCLNGQVCNRGCDLCLDPNELCP